MEWALRIDSASQVFLILAVGTQFFGYLIRNEYFLRILLLIGTTLYIVYYFTVGPEPLWDAIVAGSLLFGANFYSLLFATLDRTTFWMPPDARALYAYFPNFTPGQYRRILRHATWHVAEEGETLCEEGVEPKCVHLIFEGPTKLWRGGRQLPLDAGIFIGEISFLRGRGAPATATVTVEPGTRYVSWQRERLFRMVERSTSIANAISALFNRDMADKLAKSSPDSAPGVPGNENAPAEGRSA